mmetsp:Transcript_28677/g.67345  ORF Transcript_28677/g.67345 Transcript_28677/m.67345 type:complete len:429 (+) Transcript_28677:120-1406(+)
MSLGASPGLRHSALGRGLNKRSAKGTERNDYPGMPPKTKKKGEGKKKTKASRCTASDETATAAAEEARQRSELIERAVHLQARCTAEEARATEFRQRTEKIQEFWNIEKQSLETQKEVLQAKQAQLLSIQDEYPTKLDEKRNDIKRVQSSHDDEVARAKTKTQTELKGLQEEHLVDQNKLLAERNEHSSKLREMESSHGEHLKRLEDEHSSRITELREEYRHRSANIASRAERELKREKEEVERKRVKDVATVESASEDRVAETLKRHETEMGETHRPYNDALYRNLDLIKSLKDEAIRLKKEQRRRDAVLEEAASTNRNTVDPLAQASRDVETLAERRDLCKKQQAHLKVHRQSLRDGEAELNDLKFRYEVLFQKFEARKRGGCSAPTTTEPISSSASGMPMKQSSGDEDHALRLCMAGRSALATPG